MRKNTAEYMGLKEHLPLPASALGTLESEVEDHSVVTQEAAHAPTIEEPSPAKLARKQSTKAIYTPEPLASPNDASNDASTSEDDDQKSTSTQRNHSHIPRTAAIVRHLQPPQRTAGDGFSDDSDYFPGMQHIHTNKNSKLRASSRQRQESKDRKLARKQTEKEWKEESGMGIGRRADTLGDGDGTSDDAGLAKNQSQTDETNGMEGPILKEALKGDMEVKNSEDDRPKTAEEVATEKNIATSNDVDKLQDAERKGFGEVY